jgi:FixJ family two-component response regulator
LPKRKRVCVVDDDPGVLRAMDRLLRRHGNDTVLFESAEAFEKHSELEKALCLCMLPPVNPAAILR